jgi:DNA-binding NarL/FixJ family response regulator
LLEHPAGREQAAAIVADVGRRATGSGAVALAAGAEELATRARLHRVIARQAANVAIPLPTSAFGLTPREIEVLGHLSAGHTNRQIAERLYISEKTASVHVSNVLRKLQVSSRVQAGAVAQRMVSLEPR